jgi:branched-subunit amino acid aminotransferase/4-amino-4-deoxychorismate lyase
MRCALGPRTVASNAAASDQEESISSDVQLSLVPTRRLGPAEASEAWQRANASGMERNGVQSFYSSQLGGIVTSKNMMGMNVDESLVLQGHGVFEHLQVVNGHLYQLDERVDRLLEMSDMANIRLPSKWHKEQLKTIILETVAAGKCMDGVATVLVSLGRSEQVQYGLGASSAISSPMEASLYVMYTREDEKKSESEEYLAGWTVKTSPVPCKFAYFARIKSTDRFQDTMLVLDAQAEGFNTGIYLDGEGNVIGAPEANVAFVKKDGTLVIAEGAVSTLSSRRLLELIQENQDDIQISSVERRTVALEEAKGEDVVEMMLIGSQFPVMPVVSWDGQAVGDGEVGIVSLQCRTLLLSDIYPVTFDDGSVLPKHSPVPFGVLTGM